MFFIAQRFGVTLNALIAANPHIANPAEIFPGDVLCVPGTTMNTQVVEEEDTEAVEETEAMTSNRENEGEVHAASVPVNCPPGYSSRYVVQDGDSMFKVAQRFNVSLEALIAANPQISNPAEIFPGDVLCVPMLNKGRRPTKCPVGFGGRYTVKAGDSMFFIARRFGIDLDTLVDANPHIANPAQIFPGDVLCVPSMAGRVPAKCPKGFNARYTVQAGDSMYFIAKRVGITLQALIRANPHITNPAEIFPGDVLCVPRLPR